MLMNFYFRARRKICDLRRDAEGVSRWSNLMDSRNILRLLRPYFNPNIPPAINLEINSDCSYKCPFCPQSSNPRPVRHITMDAFRYVISELKQLDYSNVLVFSVNNEPFLHPLFLDFCKITSEELPNATTCLISNGSLITTEHLKAFSALDHPPRITINDYTPDHKINTRLRSWIANPPFSRLPINLIQRSWKETLSNRAGNQPKSRVSLKDCCGISCAWPFMGLFLNPDLKAFLCCSDYNYSIIVGDLNKQRLMEIWTGEPLKVIRDALLIPDRTRISLCAKCDAAKLNWPLNLKDLKNISVSIGMPEI